MQVPDADGNIVGTPRERSDPHVDLQQLRVNTHENVSSIITRTLSPSPLRRYDVSPSLGVAGRGLTHMFVGYRTKFPCPAYPTVVEAPVFQERTVLGWMLRTVGGGRGHRWCDW